MSDAPSPMRIGWFWGLVVFAFVASIVAIIFPGIPRSVGLLALVAVSPLPLIGAVQHGRTSDIARALAFAGWLMSIMAGIGLVVLVILSPHMENKIIQPGALAPAAIGGLLACFVSFLGLLCFAPRVRQWFARFVPLDPQSFPQVFALASAIPAIGMCVIPLIVTGHPLTENQKSAEAATNYTPNEMLAMQIGQTMWFVGIAIVCAGFPLYRTLKEVAERLGVGRVSLMKIAAAIGFAAVMTVAIPGLEQFQKMLWHALDWPTTNEEKFEKLIEFAFTWYGALIVGLTAGIGEELFFRGLLQPRLGLLLSNSLFAVFHATQYNWDAVLGVFFIGLILGLIRRRYNTTTSMIVHGFYDVFSLWLVIYAQNHLGLNGGQ